MAAGDRGAGIPYEDMYMNRREFLKAGGVGLGAMAAGSASGQVTQRPLATGQRMYVAGKYALELDNAQAGWLFSADGGSAYADVVAEKIGPDRIQRKHLAGVKFEDIQMEFGTGMSKGVYNWIKATMDGKTERHNGAVVAASFDNREMSRLTFNNALIAEIGLPALDASSKDAAKMSLTIRPELTRQTRTPGGAIVGTKGTIGGALQKRWLPSNFRLRIDGLERTCSRVHKIDALTIKQRAVEDRVGDGRDYAREPGTLEIPNLSITVPESYAEELYRWHEDFVIRGNCGQDKEKGGMLEYLTSDLREVLFVVTFRGLGIFRLAPEKADAGAEQLRRVKAEMYCEELKFDYKGAIA